MCINESFFSKAGSFRRRRLMDVKIRKIEKRCRNSPPALQRFTSYQEESPSVNVRLMSCVTCRQLESKRAVTTTRLLTLFILQFFSTPCINGLKTAKKHSSYIFFTHYQPFLVFLGSVSSTQLLAM